VRAGLTARGRNRDRNLSAAPVRGPESIQRHTYTGILHWDAAACLPPWIANLLDVHRLTSGQLQGTLVNSRVGNQLVFMQLVQETSMTKFEARIGGTTCVLPARDRMIIGRQRTIASVRINNQQAKICLGHNSLGCGLSDNKSLEF
jgi:hypothetical protein